MGALVISCPTPGRKVHLLPTELATKPYRNRGFARDRPSYNGIRAYRDELPLILITVLHSSVLIILNKAVRAEDSQPDRHQQNTRVQTGFSVRPCARW